MIESTSCKLVKKCESDKCGSDVFMLPGYLEEDMDFDNSIKFADWTFPKHDTYVCFPTYKKNKHDIFPITDDLHKEIKRISGEEKISLVGFCFGGNVAQNYVVQHPKKVEKLALILVTDLKRMSPLISRLMKIPDMETVRTVDYKELQKKIGDLGVETYIYKCNSDIISGDLPSIKGARVKSDWYCLHTVPINLKNELASFLDGTL